MMNAITGPAGSHIRGINHFSSFCSTSLTSVYLFGIHNREHAIKPVFLTQNLHPELLLNSNRATTSQKTAGKGDNVSILHHRHSVLSNSVLSKINK